MGMKMDPSSSQNSSLATDDDDDISLPDAPPTADRKEHSNNTKESEKIALEDIFVQDDSSDDEFPTSSATAAAAIPSSPPPPAIVADKNNTVAANGQTESYSDPHIMLQFYSRLFPFRALFLWLNHSPRPGPDFSNREFALTLPNDAYLRYQSYATADMLRKDIMRLNPSRFEIGPVYTTNPRDRKTLRKSSMFRPLSKEIVFDIDLTDYDDIRSCCTGASICQKCWTFATMAIKTVDVALREDFGFEHVLWVYSGRRGVHAWISDKEARELDDDKRKAITGYFELLKGGVQGGKRVNVKRPLHPHVKRSLEILKPYFQQNVLADQEPFRSERGQERLLQLLPDKELNDALRKKWTASPDRPSRKKWDDIDELAKTGVSKHLDTRALVAAKQDVLLEYTYPRLDVEVGKKRIHLLKSPFVVHPGTGRVCVPITVGGDMTRAETFDPLTVPKVTELLKEVDAFSASSSVPSSSTSASASLPLSSSAEKNTGTAEGGGGGGGGNESEAPTSTPARKLNDWEKTRLKPYVELFETYVRGIVKAEAVSLKREWDEDGKTGADGMEF